MPGPSHQPLQERLSQRQWPSFATNFASGTVAAVAATIITQPADVVRTHMQLGLARPTAAVAGAAAAGVARASSLHTLAHIMREQGTRGLMAGAMPRIVKRTFQTALVWGRWLPAAATRLPSNDEAAWRSALHSHA